MISSFPLRGTEGSRHKIYSFDLYGKSLPTLGLDSSLIKRSWLRTFKQLANHLGHASAKGKIC
jgi:hypothetical protein